MAVAVADMLVDHTQVEELVQAHKVPPVGHMLPAGFEKSSTYKFKLAILASTNS
jgi:hypothetical protein